MVETLYRFAKDTGITADDIIAPYSGITPENALMIKDEIDVGEYISMRNQNNLSEVLIYRRTPFKSHDDSVIRWDGVSTDMSWYEDAKPDATVYYIQNPDQLAGFSKLVADGVDFSGKTVKLISNINLNNKTWRPIGYPEEEGGEKKPFKGVFDGSGYAVYNLAIITTEKWSGVRPDLAFFGTLVDATIKNVNFEQVRVNDSRSAHGGVAAVCVAAINTTFINVTVSGRIAGNVCASIALYAEDSAFYNCINRASFKVSSFLEKDTIICGGIVARLSISRSALEKVGSAPIRIFEKCYQSGDILVSVKDDVKSIALGHMYGEFVYSLPEGSIDAANILIDRCITTTHPITVEDHGHKIDHWGFFARINDAVYGSNYSDELVGKVDMLDGLIGATPTDVGVAVIRPTMSTVVDKLVIPGSLNTLRSKPYIRDFVTEDSSLISDEDGVINMNPYFSYVKTVGV